MAVSDNQGSPPRYPKPIIGIVGGIGAGKSSAAEELKKAGCLVIDSDRLAHQTLNEPAISSELERVFGPEIIGTSGSIDRRKLGALVFRNPENIKKLNALIHPRVEQLRREIMASTQHRADILAVVLDSPLLVESGLHKQCDAIIFVDSPIELRQQRVLESRGWDGKELARRENFQAALDKKREIADHIVINDGEPSLMGNQVREVLNTVLARFGRIDKG